MKKKKQDEVIIEPTRFDPTIEEGLNDEQVQVRRDQGLANKIIKKTGKSYTKIIVDNFCTLFNIIYLVIFILLFIAQTRSGELKISNFAFVPIVLVNIAIGTFQEIKSKQIINKLQLISTPSVTVVRNKEKVEVDVEDVVLDDIIFLTPGKEIITDSILASGEVEVNESQLTGESVPVKKEVGDTLFSGSFVVSGNCYAKVDKVGSENAIEKLSLQAKQYRKPNSQILNALNKLILIITIFLFITGFLMFFQNYNFAHFENSTSGFGKFIYEKFYLGFVHKLFPAASSNWNETILSTCTALVGMIPSGLLLLTSVALALGVIRLAKHNTMVQDIYCIEMLARVDVLCLDKTGTITDGSMTVVNYDDLQKNKYPIVDIISSMNGALNETNSTAKALVNFFGNEKIKKALEIFPFSSDRKLSAVKFEDGLYLLGAPEFVLQSAYTKYEDKVAGYANKGYRVLCLAVTQQEFKNDKLPRPPKPIAFILIEDQIRPEASDTIRYFRENGVEVKVISGDNPVTVSEVARRVGIVNAENFISLDGLTDEEVYEKATEYTVFGRVKPNQKKIIVQALKAAKKTVAMTGDGVNDILALKEADCSIAMASGSDAVRSVAQLVLLDSNFASMPKVVDEGRRAINNIQQTSMLYLVKTFFVLTISLLTVLGFFKATCGDGRFPIDGPSQLLMLEAFVIGIPSFFLALQPNTKRVSGNFLWNVLQKALPGVIAIVLAIVTTYLLHRPCGFTLEITKTIVVTTTTAIGLMILYLACRPMTWKKALLFASMAFICAFLSFESMKIKPDYIGGFNLSAFIHNQLSLEGLYTVESFVENGVTYKKLNLTPALLAISLTAFSYIIMSVTRQLIDLINKFHMIKQMKNVKKELMYTSDEERYIDHDHDEQI